LGSTAASQQQLSRDVVRLQDEVKELKARLNNQDKVLKQPWVRFGLAVRVVKPGRSSNGG
jgi:hypothetical protein